MYTCIGFSLPFLYGYYLQSLPVLTQSIMRSLSPKKATPKLCLMLGGKLKSWIGLWIVPNPLLLLSAELLRWLLIHWLIWLIWILLTGWVTLVKQCLLSFAISHVISVLQPPTSLSWWSAVNRGILSHMQYLYSVCLITPWPHNKWGTWWANS